MVTTFYFCLPTPTLGLFRPSSFLLVEAFRLVEGVVEPGTGSILLKYLDATNLAWTIEICHKIATDNLLRLSMDYLLQ